MIYTIICSRKDKVNKSLSNLISYLTRADIKYYIAYDQESIFKGYELGLEELKPNPEDIIILCHDDIELLSDVEDFKQTLVSSLADPKIGFVGPAGTTDLGIDATWWHQTRRSQGLHSGFVFQGSNRETMIPNYFGPCRNVVVLDGCFIAARKSTLDLVEIKKPKSFPTNWDFYDLYYTMRAYELGFTNRTIAILILHNSDGEMRPTWDENRKAFRNMFRLPVRCK